MKFARFSNQFLIITMTKATADQGARGVPLFVLFSFVFVFVSVSHDSSRARSANSLETLSKIRSNNVESYLENFFLK